MGDSRPTRPQAQRAAALAVVGGNWAAQGPGPANAYQCYTNIGHSILISGTAIAVGDPLTLQQGWNQIAYWRDVPLAIDNSLASCGIELVIAKNGAGTVYWPEYDINQIGVMQPGQGYLVYLDNGCTLSYPES